MCDDRTRKWETELRKGRTELRKGNGGRRVVGNTLTRGAAHPTLLPMFLMRFTNPSFDR